MSSNTGMPVAGALPTLVIVIWNWTTLPGAATLAGTNVPEVPVRTSFVTLMSGFGDTVTVVNVRHSGSLLSAGQLLPGPVTTTTFGSCVVPTGNVLLSVTLNVRSSVVPAGIVGMVQDRILVVAL